MSQEFHRRLVADYTGDQIEPKDAAKLVESAENFVAAIKAEFLFE